MNVLERARAFATRDPLRKGGALLLALVVWTVVWGQTTGPESFSLAFHPLRPGEEPRGGQALYVRVPAGLELVVPPPVTIRLRGPRQSLGMLSAFHGVFDPGADFQGGRVVVSPERIAWSPARVRDFFPRDNPFDLPELRLDFERIVSKVVRLAPANVDVQGDPADGYVKRLERLQFSPPVVTLLGRASAVERLVERLKVERTVLFRPLVLQGESRQVRRRLRLATSLEAEGFHLDEGDVEVTLPIEAEPVVIRFRGRVEAVALGEGAARRLETYEIASSDREGDFELVAPAGSTLATLPPEGVAEHVRLFVDFGEIAAETAERPTVVADELRIRWVFRLPAGAEPPPEAFVRSADPRGKMAVTVEKRSPGRSPPPHDG